MKASPPPGSAPDAVLTHALLAGCGAPHGFGTRALPVPPGLLRPRQVHGARVASARECAGPHPAEADAVVSTHPGVSVGVVTADCVPVLLASACGTAVAAVHAGWRGLAAGVIGAGVDALRQSRAAASGGGARGASTGAGTPLSAVIGPHIGACCYEVDAPVIDALAARFAGRLDAALGAARAGHAMLDLGALARAALEASGVPAERIGDFPHTCTRCDPQRFHSYRRDGPRAGRLAHFIAVAGSGGGSGREA